MRTSAFTLALAPTLALALLLGGCGQDQLVQGAIVPTDAKVDGGGGALSDGAGGLGDGGGGGGGLDGGGDELGGADGGEGDDANGDVASCPDCPPGYVCRLVGGPARCVADPALACVACTSDLLCLGGRCASAGAGPKGCLLPCPDGDGGCPAGYACAAPDADGLRVCTPTSGDCSCTPAVAGAVQACGGGVGACAGTRSCSAESGWSDCVAGMAQAEQCNLVDDDCDGETDEGLGGATCTATSGCPGVLQCSAGVATCVADALACAPKPAPICTPCGDDADCGAGFCLDGGCTQGCGEGCPDGSQCSAIIGKGGNIVSACLPPGGDCSCTAANAGAVEGCSVDNAHGSCAGNRVCGAGGWGPCSAAIPAAEACNGGDDDCDGATDEGLPSDLPCSVTSAAGACAGVQTCTGAAGWACVGPTPIAETCNGDDDDCDGATDEGFLVAGKYVQDAHCGVCGNDCGGQFAHGKGVCDGTGALPSCVLAACDAGYVVGSGGGCVPAPPLGQCESCDAASPCGAGLVCTPLGNGSVCTAACASGCSAGFVCAATAVGERCLPVGGSCGCTPAQAGTTRSCGPASGAPGCMGVETCVPPLGWLGCTAKTPAPESCNGLDDDCDGDTDEPVTGDGNGASCSVDNGHGSCKGVVVCQGGAGLGCDAAEPAAELCNGEDDDCDGDTDEDFKDGAGVLATTSHCGACGKACPLPIGMATAATCTVDAGVAQCGQVCVPGWIDADGNAANGCECVFQSEVDAPDGADQNCDGVDGVAALAVFVAKTGSDSNPGTRLLPQRTLAKALLTAQATGKPHLYVGAGVYAENVDVVAGVSIFGGYAAGFGVRDPLSYQTVLQGVSVPSGVQATLRCSGVVGGTKATPSRIDGLTIVGIAPAAAGASSFAVHSVGCDARFALVGCQVLAGPGAAGKGGATGKGGAGGGTGAKGVAAKDIGHAVCVDSDANPGGAGAPSSCQAPGGDGGAAICPVMDEEAPTPACPAKPYVQTAKAEETGATGGAATGGAPGGKGGPPGWDSYIDSWLGVATACKGGPGCGTCRVPVQQRDGGDGEDGAPGAHGVGGTGGADVGGKVVDGAWLGGSGAPGASGQAGGGGGGGGAAGGVEVHDCDKQSAHYSDISGSGGGGGAGGCGGAGGAGGAAGGGSFAVLIVPTKVAGGADLPIVLGNLLLGGQGGAGGAGGPGGGGGNGGKGAKGGAAGEDKTETFCTSAGGDGGDGGDGGHGGGGGGGAGGASAALVIVGAPADALSAIAGLNQLVAGKAGAGGAGGPSAGNPGKPGKAGLATDVLAL